MIFRPFRRRRPPAQSAVFDLPRAGMRRALDAMPSANVADMFVELASRTGVDLGEVADRVFDRLGELAARAGDEVSGLGETNAARQLRDVAARAAGNAAELAYRAGADRLLEAVPRHRKRSRGGFVVLGVVAGLAVAGAVGYMMVSRREDEKRRQVSAAADDGGLDSPPATGASSIGTPPTAPAPVSAHAGSLLERLKQRFRLARGEARTAQVETERELWLQYNDGVYGTNTAGAGSPAGSLRAAQGDIDTP